MKNELACGVVIFLLFGCAAQTEQYPQYQKLMYGADGTVLVTTEGGARVYDNALAQIKLIGVPNYCYILDDATPLNGSVLTVQEKFFVDCNVDRFLLIKWYTNGTNITRALDIYTASGKNPSLSLRPDQKEFAIGFDNFSNYTADYNHGVLIADPQTLSISRLLEMHGSPVPKFSPDGQYLGILASNGSQNNSITVFSTKNYELLKTFYVGDTKDFDWSANGSIYLIVSDYEDTPEGLSKHINRVVLLDPGNGFQTDVARADCGDDASLGCFMEQIRVSPDSRYLAIGGRNPISACPSLGNIVCSLGSMDIVDAKSGKTIYRYGGGTYRGNLVHFDWSPDGSLFYVLDGEAIKKYNGTVNPS